MQKKGNSIAKQSLTQIQLSTVSNRFISVIWRCFWYLSSSNR